MKRLPLIALAFMGLWFFAGALGLVIAVVIAVAWSLRMRKRFFWLAGILLLAAAPLAIIGQGLPSRSVVGSDFGSRHWIAHVLVAFALAFVALATLLELTADRAEDADGDAVPHRTEQEER
jgi:hypothetical protein